MSENKHYDEPRAIISPLRGISWLWCIPLLTLFVGAGMVYNNWQNQGPLIEVAFNNADGLEAGKSVVKSRNVTVGSVEEISLNEDHDGVILKIRMNKEFSNKLVEDSQFWVVQPRLGLSGVSGLGTLLSGQYVEYSQGKSQQARKHYVGLGSPPLTPIGTPGLHVTLNTEEGFSYAEGDPVYYQGRPVGKIEHFYFNANERMFYYNVFIEAPYHQLITTNTRFWDSSGVRVELTEEGASLQTGPLLSVIRGGLSFSIPEGEPPGEMVKERAYYYIYSSKSAINEKIYDTAIRYVIMVAGDIGDLSVDAPVMYRGLRIGRVQHMDYFVEGVNLLKKGRAIPVYLSLNPARLGLEDSEQGAIQAKADIRDSIAQGLSATLISKNILLGKKIVELNYSDNITERKIVNYNGLDVIPLGQNGMAKVIDSIGSILNKIDGIPIESIGSHLDQLFAEASQALASIDKLAKSGEEVVSDIRGQELVATLNNTLVQMDRLAKSYSDEAPANRDLQRLLETATEAFLELKPLLIELKNKPNGLIFTGGAVVEPEPERKSQ